MIEAIVIGLLLVGFAFLYMCLIFTGMEGIRKALKKYPPRTNRKPWEGW